jgi:hypothetical protein
MNGSDRSIRVLLVVIVFLLGANLLVNMNGHGGSPKAYGDGIPDTGAQIQAVVDQVTELNKKVDKVDAFLEGGHLTVTVQDSKSEK